MNLRKRGVMKQMNEEPFDIEKLDDAAKQVLGVIGRLSVDMAYRIKTNPTKQDFLLAAHHIMLSFNMMINMNAISVSEHILEDKDNTKLDDFI